VYSVGCCAFRNNRQDNAWKRYPWLTLSWLCLNRESLYQLFLFVSSVYRVLLCLFFFPFFSDHILCLLYFPFPIIVSLCISC
jgi:hypothetical protein